MYKMQKNLILFLTYLLSLRKWNALLPSAAIITVDLLVIIH